MKKIWVTLTADARMGQTIEIEVPENATPEQIKSIAIESSYNNVWNYDGVDDSTIEVEIST